MRWSHISEEESDFAIMKKTSRIFKKETFYGTKNPKKNVGKHFLMKHFVKKKNLKTEFSGKKQRIRKNRIKKPQKKSEARKL